MKTAELTGRPLNYAAAIALGFTYTMRPVSCEIVYAHASGEYHFGDGWNPSENWAQGGPIIEREKIGTQDEGQYWLAECNTGDFHNRQQGPTPLIAAMRCFVCSRLGNKVEIPKELL